MTRLAAFTLAIGIIKTAAALPLLISPVRAQQVLKAFPRHEWSGRILAALALAWSIALVREMPLGWFDAYKGWLYVGGPLVYVLVVMFLDELLAARALGGVLLLVADPVLESAAFQASPLRLVVVLVAYAWVAAGMALVLAPYWFRKTMERVCGTPGRCRVTGGSLLLLGAVLSCLGLLAF